MVVTVAATQMSCGWDVGANIAQAEALVRSAHAQGAQIIVLPELFERRYFCQQQDATFLAFAAPLAENAAVRHFQAIAHELQVVLPISFYERANQALYNSVAVITTDGSICGVYRKSHIPDGPGYCEKFYFTPGDTGFRVWATPYGQIGVGICWDQWFPEAARAMVLMGADLLCFPTAIGSEPQDPTLNSLPHWRNTQCGHAAANLTPLVASNRTGHEALHQTTINFYGNSFIADETGTCVAQMDAAATGVAVATFDWAALALRRRAWGVFRDRRPDLYGALLTQDGQP